MPNIIYHPNLKMGSRSSSSSSSSDSLMQSRPAPRDETTAEATEKNVSGTYAATEDKSENSSSQSPGEVGGKPLKYLRCISTDTHDRLCATGLFDLDRFRTITDRHSHGSHRGRALLKYLRGGRGAEGHYLYLQLSYGSICLPSMC